MSAGAESNANVAGFLAFVARELVDDSGSVHVGETVSGSTLSFEISVAPGDVGKIIGRHGRVAAALRAVAKAIAGRHRRIFVDIRD